MTKPKDMWVDFLDRTRELLCEAEVSTGELAFHTGLSQRWIDCIRDCTDDDSATFDDASKLAKLHDWLVVLELAKPTPRFGPESLLRSLGETAVAFYEHRQQTASSGLIPISERASILRDAKARLRQGQK
jgi:hypothetical protein